MNDHHSPQRPTPVFGDGPHSPKIKICGITRPEDAMAAEQAGADAVGFVFVKGTKRHVSAEQAAALSALLGPGCARVGVFVDASEEEILRTVEVANLSAVQLHGNEPPRLAQALMSSVRVIRALPFTAAPTPEAASGYPSHAVLLDAPTPGSGVAFPWREAAAWRSHPHLVLAGGLHPRNVADAVRALRPYAVDVSSGVEDPAPPPPGERVRKSAELIKQFVAAARAALP